MISSPPKTFNWFTALMEMAHPVTGEPMFLVLRHSLICKRCQETRKNPEKCPHRLHEIPPWKGDDAIAVSAVLYGANTSLMMAETMGAIMNGGGLIFNPDDIKHLEEKCTVPWTVGFPNPEFIMIGCDPNAGGSDHTGITMITQVAGTFYVRVLSIALSLVLFSAVVSGPQPFCLQ